MRKGYSKCRNYSTIKISCITLITADTDLLKMVPVEILLNFENYFCTLQLGFQIFFQELCFFITKYAL